MPKDNIERAIARGAGRDRRRRGYEHVTYEGYGPGGVAVFVEALTDNRNRTAAEVRHVFAKHEGNLGRVGRGRVAVRAQGRDARPGRRVDEDELMLAAADAGAEDVGRAARATR